MLIDDLQPYISDLVNRKITNREVARLLKCGESHLCRLLKQQKVVKIPAKSSKNHKIQAKNIKNEKNKLIDEASRDLSLTLVQAAKIAGCSTRTIMRRRK